MEHERKCEKHRKGKSVSVTRLNPRMFPLSIPSRTGHSQTCASLYPFQENHFSAGWNARKKHFDRMCKSGRIRRRPARVSGCTSTSSIGFLVRLSYARNTRETRRLFFFRKKKSAPSEGSSVMRARVFSEEKIR